LKPPNKTTGMGKPNPLWRAHIPDKGMNAVIEAWHAQQPMREQTVASPSTLTECPRVVWLNKHKVPFTNPKGWGQKQRLLLGRNFENKIAEQLKDEGKLLWHWKDDVAGESVKFGMGEGLSRIEGTPDLLLNLTGVVLISDSKTSRADSFAYVPLNDAIWEDELWYHYKLQVECYYLLCHRNKDWFKEHGLLLPEACHLFSFALDDGVIKRELTWKPTKEVAEEILAYAKRWNAAYQSDTMPECLCTETQMKFCSFGYAHEVTRTGYKLQTKCCKGEGYVIPNQS